jgi:hypothetical protein
MDDVLQMIHPQAGVLRFDGHLTGAIYVLKSTGKVMHLKDAVFQFHSSFLHCGVSNTAGAVYHFDEHGMHLDVKWPECLSIPIVWDQVADEVWDTKLEEHYRDEER